MTEYTSTGTFVHRIKVDESAGYILTTKSNGGLAVTDLESDSLLWYLPEVWSLSPVIDLADGNC
jgi:hypothetical protein